MELLDKKQINLFVWDFGVNPSAPQNAGAWMPRQPDKGNTDQVPALEKSRRSRAFSEIPSAARDRYSHKNL